MKNPFMICIILLTLVILTSGCVQQPPTKSHNECVNQKCVEVQGLGTDQCQENNDCITCENECPQDGLMQCSGNGYRTCVNYDSDSCLEWSSITACPEGTACQNGECEKQDSDGLIIDGGSNLNEQIIKEYMVWDLPELSGFIYGGLWERVGEGYPNDCIDLRYRSPQDNDQHSEFYLCMFNSSEQAENYFNSRRNPDGSIIEINGNKVIETTSTDTVGHRALFWISGKNVLTGWNGNDLGTVVDDALFDVLTEAYLEKYPSTYECSNGTCNPESD